MTRAMWGTMKPLTRISLASASLLVASLLLPFSVSAAKPEPGTAKLDSASLPLTDAGSGESWSYLDEAIPVRLRLAGPAKFQVDFRLNIKGVSLPSAVLSVLGEGKPVQAWRVSAKPGGEWKGMTLKSSLPTGFFIEVPDGEQTWEFRLKGTAPDGAAIQLVAADKAKKPLTASAGTLRTATTVAAAPVATATPAAAKSSAASDSGPREPRFSAGAELGYVLNGGDVSGAIMGADLGFRPSRRGALKDLTVHLAVERYDVSAEQTANDPLLGDYTRSYDFSFLPILLGVRWSKGLGAVDLLSEAGAGVFLVDGTWGATNEQGAIEPTEKAGGLVPGFRLGIGAGRRLGPGSLTGMFRWRQASIDNGEKLDPVYPQDGSAYRILGDVGGYSATVGYRFAF